MNRRRSRRIVCGLMIGFIVGVGLGGLSQPDLLRIKSIESTLALLEDLIVGVSNASFVLNPDTACNYYPVLDGTARTPRWLAVSDIAIVGSAHLNLAGETVSIIALYDNLQTTLTRIGDFAADILGTLPLILEIRVEQWSDDLASPFGWIVFDAESLRTAQVPAILENNEMGNRLDSYADDIAREIGLAIRDEDWRYRIRPRGYLPGVGIYYEFALDSYDDFLPSNLNTVPKWQDRLTLIFEKLGDDVLSAMADDELLIVSVEGFVGQDKTFFLIGRDDLLEPSAWEIVYW